MRSRRSNVSSASTVPAASISTRPAAFRTRPARPSSVARRQTNDRECRGDRPAAVPQRAPGAARGHRGRGTGRRRGRGPRRERHPPGPDAPGGRPLQLRLLAGRQRRRGGRRLRRRRRVARGRHGLPAQRHRVLRVAGRFRAGERRRHRRDGRGHRQHVVGHRRAPSATRTRTSSRAGAAGSRTSATAPRPGWRSRAGARRRERRYRLGRRLERLRQDRVLHADRGRPAPGPGRGHARCGWWAQRPTGHGVLALGEVHFPRQSADVGAAPGGQAAIENAARTAREFPASQRRRTGPQRRGPGRGKPGLDPPALRRDAGIRRTSSWRSAGRQNVKARLEPLVPGTAGQCGRQRRQPGGRPGQGGEGRQPRGPARVDDGRDVHPRLARAPGAGSPGPADDAGPAVRREPRRAKPVRRRPFRVGLGHDARRLRPGRRRRAGSESTAASGSATRSRSARPTSRRSRWRSIRIVFGLAKVIGDVMTLSFLGAIRDSDRAWAGGSRRS